MGRAGCPPVPGGTKAGPGNTTRARPFIYTPAEVSAVRYTAEALPGRDPCPHLPGAVRVSCRPVGARAKS
jgi:hypothetical protein